jgi:hypothetical protein
MFVLQSFDCFDFSENKCEEKIDKTYYHCYSEIENSAYGSQMADLPQILKDARKKFYKTPSGKKFEAFRAKA